MQLKSACLKVATAAIAFCAMASGAEAQGTHVAIEGGVACSRNRTIVQIGDVGAIGDKGCGGTGAVEVGQTGKPVFSVFDHWAVRGRYTGFDQERLFTDPRGNIAASFEDSRVVIDAELGAKLGFGLFGGTSRATIGLRAANWTGDYDAKVTTGPALGNTVTGRFETSMVGVRVGLRSTIPLATHWMYESSMGAAVMHGRHSARSLRNGGLLGEASENNPVFSFDSSSALSYKFNGTDTGLIGSIGLFSEYWFKQTDIGADSRSRHSWGPFVRARMPLQ